MKEQIPTQSEIIKRAQITYAVMGVIGLFVAVFAYPNFISTLEIPALSGTTLAYLFLPLGIVVASHELIKMKFLSFTEHQQSIHQIWSKLSTSQGYYISCFAAISEELFFRAALQPALGVVLTASMVTMLHISPKLKYTGLSALSFIKACVLGLIYAASQSLILVILSHFLINIHSLLQLQKIKISTKEVSESK